jgi:hypothetical protein
MAKNIGKLAGLAALAGAAYMMSKGKDKDKGSDDAGDQKTSSYTKDTKKVGSDGTQLKTQAESIAAADKSDKSTSISTKGATGTTTPGPDKSVPNLDVKPTPAPKPKVEAQVDKDVKPKSVSEPSDKSVKLAPENRDLEKNTSRGIPAKQKPVSTVSSSEEGMKNYKPRRTTTAPASTSSSSAEGMKNYKPRSTQPSSAKNPAVYGLKEAVKTTAKTAMPLVAPATAAASRVPTSEQAAANRQAVYDNVKSGAKKVGNYLSDTFTMEGRERAKKEAKDRYGMKRGGTVNMASGGLTASRRGDGIAQRGKTRGKMC